MNTEQKLKAVSRAYCTMEKDGNTIHILDTDAIKDMATQNAIMDIQHSLGVDFEQSYEVMADACDIIAEKTLTNNGTGLGRDCLTGNDCDFYADADSRANVYTSVQLSYLNVNNEAEISDLVKDEAITSIAQACAVWRTQKVVEACEALKSYILS